MVIREGNEKMFNLCSTFAKGNEFKMNKIFVGGKHGWLHKKRRREF